MSRVRKLPLVNNQSCIVGRVAVVLAGPHGEVRANAFWVFFATAMCC